MQQVCHGRVVTPQGEGSPQVRDLAGYAGGRHLTRVLLSAGLLVLGRVDPGCAWQFRRGWRFADEAFGVSEIGGVQDLGAPGPDGFGRPWWTSAAVCRPSPP